MLRQQSHSSDAPAPVTGPQPGSLHSLSSPQGLLQDEGQRRSPAEDGALFTEIVCWKHAPRSNLQAVTEV